MRAAAVAAALVLFAAPARAEPLCRLVEAQAAAHGLPVEFLSRLLWTESRFRSEVTSPKGAEGVAQFMPGTAAARGLADPRDPAGAVAAAARLLAELDRRFGNLGLAAAAYNAGAARVEKFLHGGALPDETRRYVAAITGRPVEAWRGAGDAAPPPAAPGACDALIAALVRRERQAPPAPSWQTRLDGGLSRAIALLASLPPRAPPSPAAEALCGDIRALGAACAVEAR
jgi:hypothetical protein